MLLRLFIGPFTVTVPFFSVLLSKIEYLFGQHFLPKKHEVKKSPFGKGDLGGFFNKSPYKSPLAPL